MAFREQEKAKKDKKAH
jgi:hypothetical protein